MVLKDFIWTELTDYGLKSYQNGASVWASSCWTSVPSACFDGFLTNLIFFNIVIDGDRKKHDFLTVQIILSFSFFFPNFFFFVFYMCMIAWSKQNTSLFVNTMPKYIYSNINPTYTYTNTGVINMYMHRHIHILI